MRREFVTVPISLLEEDLVREIEGMDPNMDEQSLSIRMTPEMFY